MIALLLSTLLIRPADACVGLVHTPETLAATAGQQVLFYRDAEASNVEYRVRYTGDATDFGWVIPVPGAVLDVSDGDDSVFVELDEATRPTVSRVSVVPFDGPGSSCGCAGSVKAGSDSNALELEELDITIDAEGFTGTYSWTALDINRPGALSGWLTERGFTAGLPEGTTEPYELDGSWRFLVVELQRDALGEAVIGDLPPLRVRYDSTVLSYPARMARLLTGNRYRLTVFVQGPERASADPWTATELGFIEGDTDPVAAFEDALYGLGGATPGFGITWAGRWREGWLTRFDALMEAEAHTSDPQFILDDGTLAASTEIEVWEDEEEGAAALIVPLAFLGWWRRRRR